MCDLPEAYWSMESHSVITTARSGPYGNPEKDSCGQRGHRWRDWLRGWQLSSGDLRTLLSQFMEGSFKFLHEQGSYASFCASDGYVLRRAVGVVH